MTADQYPPFSREPYERLADMQIDIGLLRAQKIDLLFEKDVVTTNLIPVGGWPGKNSEERKAAEDKATYADEEWRDIEARLRKCETDIVALEHRILANEELKRAQEWGIRHDYVEEMRRCKADEREIPW